MMGGTCQCQMVANGSCESRPTYEHELFNLESLSRLDERPQVKLGHHYYLVTSIDCSMSNENKPVDVTQGEYAKLDLCGYVKLSSSNALVSCNLHDIRDDIVV